MNNEIKEWLNRQNVCIQEAAYRLLTKGKLDDEDILDLVLIIKNPTAEFDINRILPELGTANTTNHVKLVSIGNVIGIDNLSPREPLNFGNGNLVVVYGHNGSGKSGYSRILKKASGKPGAVSLKPNIYKDIPANSSCDISVLVNGDVQQQTWIANSEPLDSLKQIDIFDSATGRVYLTKETEVAYNPPELVFFSDLFSICGRIEKVLEGERQQLISSLPVMPVEFQNTNVFTIYTSIAPATAFQDFTSVISWLDSDQSRFDELQKKLATNDPIALADKIEAQAAQVNKIYTAIELAINSISVESQKALSVLLKCSSETKQAANDAANALTDSTKVDGIASASWRLLWEAAREFSLAEAYKEKEFPNVGDDAKCVLCHQDLDNDTRERLKKFESHIQSTLQSEADAAKIKLDDAIKRLPEKPSEDELEVVFIAADISPEIQSQIRQAWEQIHSSVLIIKESPLNNQDFDVVDVLSVLVKINKDYTLEATALREQATHFDRKQAEIDIKELKAKHWVSQQSEAVLAEIERCKKQFKLTEFSKQTSTTGISRKAGELSQALITDAYISRFNQELSSLGAQKIQVELVKTRASQGGVKHQIKLKGMRVIQNDPSEVLSEGESRVVSLAAFLADVTGKAASVPFIFDDPISSLDHDFEWYVATRLATLATQRQVIVLTHRLSLYGGLEDAAKRLGEEFKKTQLEQRCIEAFNNSTGHPVVESMWQANTKKANNILIDQYLKRAKDAVLAHDSISYKILAQQICSEFRKLLERTIEEDLINSVVLRHRRSVTTDNRIPHLAKIKSSDCEYFDKLMSKYSCYEHSQSHESPVFIPDEPELRADIEGLKNWRDEFTKREQSVGVS